VLCDCGWSFSDNCMTAQRVLTADNFRRDLAVESITGGFSVRPPIRSAGSLSRLDRSSRSGTLAARSLGSLTSLLL
jgi:hypothetical protein